MGAAFPWMWMNHEMDAATLHVCGIPVLRVPHIPKVLPLDAAAHHR